MFRIALVCGDEPIARSLDAKLVAAGLEPLAVHRAREPLIARRPFDRASREDGDLDVSALHLVVAGERADGPRRDFALALVLVRRDSGGNRDARDGACGNCRTGAAAVASDPEVGRAAAVDPHAALVVTPVDPEPAARGGALPDEGNPVVGVGAAVAVAELLLSQRRVRSCARAGQTASNDAQTTADVTRIAWRECLARISFSSKRKISDGPSVSSSCAYCSKVTLDVVLLPPRTVTVQDHATVARSDRAVVVRKAVIMWEPADDLV